MLVLFFSSVLSQLSTDSHVCGLVSLPISRAMPCAAARRQNEPKAPLDCPRTAKPSFDWRKTDRPMATHPTLLSP
ncbi:hypothetical protein C8J57DRAFT_1345070, partial [Mycena rebaudengoi]